MDDNPTAKEVFDAANALMEWFKSQEILPGHAALVFSYMMAIQAAMKALTESIASDNPPGTYEPAMREYIDVVAAQIKGLMHHGLSLCIAEAKTTGRKP